MARWFMDLCRYITCISREIGWLDHQHPAAAFCLLHNNDVDVNMMMTVKQSIKEYLLSQNHLGELPPAVASPFVAFQVNRTVTSRRPGRFLRKTEILLLLKPGTLHTDRSNERVLGAN